MKWQFNQPKSIGSSSDNTQLEVLGTERHAPLIKPALPAPANPAEDIASNPAPALAVKTQDELEKVAKAADTKVNLASFE